MTSAAHVDLVDAQARALIGSTGLGKTLFVEAGAGSGKTTALVTRIVSLVLHDGVSLREIAAITFTEAAAAELQSRIRAEFEKRQATAAKAGDGPQLQRCKQAIADIDLAAISTLHGFANRILSEFSVTAGLPPRVRVLDEVSSQLAHEERWERFVDRLHDDPANSEVLVLAAALDVPLEQRYAEQATMRDVAVDFNQNWDRLDTLAALAAADLSLPPFSGFDQAVNELGMRRSECSDTDDKFYDHLTTVLIEMVALQQISDPYRKLKAMAGMRRAGTGSKKRDKNSKGWGVSGKGKAAAWGGKDNLTEIKDLILDVNDAMAHALDEVTNRVLVELSRLVAIETVNAAERRRAEGGLEFHDLLVLARNMLRTQPTARRALHDRYKRILLDEFQDTDPIQIELAVLIATSADEVAEFAWHELPVEPGRLFFVGDPKQSIYRFRRADISLFLSARDLFVGDGDPVSLTTNFRTVEPIVDWVNAFFADHMAVEKPGLQPAYAPLAPHRESSGRDHRPVLLGGEHEDPLSAAELRELEADDVAAAISAILAEPHAWPVFDEVLKQFRDAELHDITILVPTRTSLPYLRSALDDADIRYRIATGTLVYHTQEVRDALAAVKAIDDPTDEISLVAALRSPLYCCSDVDLFTYRQAGGRWDLRIDPPDVVQPDHPVRLAVEHLRSLWLTRWWLTPSALLERLLRERRAAMLAFGNPRPADVWRRLRFLVDQARGFEEAGGGDLRAFTQWAELQGSPKARVHEPLLPETDEPALSIQTIHGSKGLEFPITMLSGMTTQFKSNRPGVSVLWDDDGEPSVKIRSGVETRNHEPRADLEGEMDEHEKMRLAYVATTRARDHLLVSCHHKAGTRESSWAGLFWKTFDHEERVELWRRMPETKTAPSAEVDPAQVGFPLDDRDQWIAARRELLAAAHVPRVLSATGVAQAAIAQAHAQSAEADEADEADQADLNDQDDDGFDQPDDGASSGMVTRRRGRVGSAVGTAVHAVLELVDFAAPTEAATHIEQQCHAAGIPTLVPVVTRLVHAALAAPSLELAAGLPHHKELYVAAPLDGRVVEGYVDLLIESPDGLIVVDYKTDAVSSAAEIDARLAAYELQAASYAVALETVTGQEVIDARFVFCRASGAIERSVGDLPAGKARVRATLAVSS